MGIDQNIIHSVKSRVDLVEIVRRYVDLKPMSGRFVAPCPFHQETKPSFSVNPDLGFFYCFGCQASGDVIDFYSRMNGLEFREALEALAEEAGVSLRDEQLDPMAARRKQLKKACLDMHALARDYFQRVLSLPAGQEARAYLNRRKLSPSMVEGFGLGCSGEDWQGLQDFLLGKGFSPAQAVEAGLLSRNDSGRTYDRFRGRLIFPIQDMAGRVIAFGGRIIKDGEPKYLNSSDSPIYTKGEHLYGLYQARPAISKSRRALLTEGYVDVLALHQHGFQEAVGVLGTALTVEQVKRLGSLCKEVVLVFDGDNAGRKAALRSAEMVLTQGLTCRVVLLPEGQDADDLLRESGPEAFARLLEQAGDGFDFCAECVRNTGSAREVLEFAKRFMRGLRDPAWKAFFLPRLTKSLRLDESAMREAVVGDGDASSRTGPLSGARPRTSIETYAPGQIKERGAKRDEYLLAFAVYYPQYRRELHEGNLADLLCSERAKNFWTAITDSLGQDDKYVYDRLDERQRGFWVRCKEAPPLKPELEAAYWNEIRTLLKTQPKQERIRWLNTAMNEAYQRGDQAEVDRLYRAVQDLLGRIDEQP